MAWTDDRGAEEEDDHATRRDNEKEGRGPGVSAWLVQAANGVFHAESPATGRRAAALLVLVTGLEDLAGRDVLRALLVLLFCSLDALDTLISCFDPPSFARRPCTTRRGTAQYTDRYTNVQLAGWMPRCARRSLALLHQPLREVVQSLLLGLVPVAELVVTAALEALPAGV